MPNLKPSEDKFYKALREIFIGAKIEGKGGYVNLMNIKSRYFEEVLLKGLWNYIDVLFPTDKEELFSKLYTFFSRYFSETGSICFQYTPIKENIYERVYTNKDDVVLFYKTHMLYYVKSEKIWKSLDISIKDDNTLEEILFSFDASEIELAKNNEKKEVIFSFQKVQDNKVYMSVGYSKNATISKYDEIIKEVKKGHKDISLDILDRAISVYKKQTEVDFFINKDANSFLKEQWDLWMYQYVFQWETDWTSGRIGTLQKMKDVAYKLIDYIAQFEDELVKVWNKPKFVRNSHYVMTLDKLSAELVEKVLESPNFTKQYKEWESLGYVLDDFEKSKVLKKWTLWDLWQYLTIDTVHFPELESQIIASFENLEESLDGIVINSDNYQALNNLKEKYYQDIQTIFIDPPYNTWKDDFAYKDWFKSASWLTMIENRISLSRHFLTPDWVFISNIGRQEQNRYWCYLDGTFPYNDPQDKLQISWQTAYGGWQTNKNNYENIFVFPSSWEFLFSGTKKQERQIRIIHWWKEDATSPVSFSIRLNYSITKGQLFIIIKIKKEQETKKIYFESEKQFREELCLNWLDKLPEYEKIVNTFILYADKLKNEQVGRAFGEGKYYIYRWLDEGYLYETVLAKKITAIVNRQDSLFSNILHQNKYKFICSMDGKNELQALVWVNDFETVKPEQLALEILWLNVSYGNVLDYFSWSWTYISVAHKMWKKWIWVEMWGYFDSIVLIRLKKVLNGEQGWVSKELEWKWWWFFKYYSLEQYEEALEKSVYWENVSLFDDSHTDPYSRYVFLADEKMTRSLERDEKSGKVKVDLSKLYPDIDIPETLSHILGKKIKTIREGFVTFADGQVIDTNDLDYNIIKPLIWWK